MKETELILIFRELMSWDYLLDEHVVKQKKEPNANKRDIERYLVPMKTFWQPLPNFERYDNNIFAPKEEINIKLAREPLRHPLIDSHLTPEHA